MRILFPADNAGPAENCEYFAYKDGGGHLCDHDDCMAWELENDLRFGEKYGWTKDAFLEPYSPAEHGEFYMVVERKDG